MTQNQFTIFKDQGLELVKNNITGEVFSTATSYSKMCGKAGGTIRERCAKNNIEKFEIPTNKLGQKTLLIPISKVIDWLLDDYYKNPTQIIFNNLLSVYTQQNLNTKSLNSLLSLIKKDKPKSANVERRIQLAYQLNYGGEIEYPTANGRIDLLTETTIYEFKVFRDYKNCLGQLLAYDDCIPGMKLIAVLFGVPKLLSIDSSECQRVKQLFNKYQIEVKFLHW